MRYFLEIAYNGEHFHGWQIQKGDVTTVQGELNRCLSIMLQQPVATIGCGRTDTGVHAKQFFLHLDIGEPSPNFIYKLNAILPSSIVAKTIFKVKDDVNSRFAATARTYEYFVHQKRDAFVGNLSYFVPKTLDVDKMNKAAELLLGEQDFTSFSKLHSQTFTNICTVTKAYWTVLPDDKLVFTVKANRFLRNMVRAIVGTLIEVGEGKLSIEDFKEVIQLKNRGKAGKSVAGGALFLAKIDYDFEAIKG